MRAERTATLAACGNVPPRTMAAAQLMLATALPLDANGVCLSNGGVRAK